MAEVWKVLTTSADRVKNLYQGLERDCRQFVEHNFPRPHVEPPGDGEPGKPDVVLVNPSGGQEQYHAEDGWSAVGGSKPSTTSGSGDLA